ncbi:MULTISPECIES: flavodoxin family protein [unclassified Nocardiopsis]|uniref:flavodoxin family protein n=1 Tax=unclassified Nocardiopsis TaxID=2649073 RepID=UPI00135B0136|nr:MULTISPECIES: flavodoxin family protein [unclassified Nocardiopsis]
MPADITVAVAFHSGHGHTARQAAAVARGADAVPGARGDLRDVSRLDAALWEALDAADAIVFGSPTYMGAPSSVFQAFAEATAPVWAARGWRGKLAAGFTNSAGVNGNKDNALVRLAVLAAQHGMVWVPLGLAPGGDYSTSGTAGDPNRLGAFLGAMAQSPSDLGPEAAPPPADLTTAEHLGTEVAELALALARGRSAEVAR